jgi:hypothetical protein
MTQMGTSMVKPEWCSNDNLLRLVSKAAFDMLVAGPGRPLAHFLRAASCLLGVHVSVNDSKIAPLESCFVRETSPES